jgi:PAS domain S-box-containing protein
LGGGAGEFVTLAPMKDYAGLTRQELMLVVRDLEQRAAVIAVEQTRHSGALSDSEERLRAILQTAVEGIITIDARGVIESFNPAAEKIFGYAAGEVIGKNVKSLMPEPYRHEHDGYLTNYHHTGHAKIIGIGREVMGCRKDGTVFTLDLAVSEVRLADRVIFAGFVRDISEHKAAEKALLHYAALVESSDDAIIGKTLEGYITSWNRGAESIFGYQSEEAVGKHISLIIPPERKQEEETILAKIRRGESVEHYETVRRRKDGKPVDISVTVSPIRERGGQIIGASKVARMISERKRLQNEILEISEREQRRIGNDLHDGLCQELAGIELMCEVLEQKLAARSKSEAAQVGEIAGHIRGAITHARKLSRGLSPVELQTNGLMSALHELTANVQERFGIECRLDCPEAVLIRNHVFAVHLFRIVQEAINNALKHGRARLVVVSLKPAAGKTKLTVTDNGAGFNEESPEGKGKGMGLHIMKYRAGMIDAVLDVHSRPGAGTTITCVFGKNL